MDYLVKLLEWLHSQPFWIKSISVLVVTLVTIILVFSSCSVSQNVVTGDGSSASSGASVTVQVDSNYVVPTFYY